MSVNFSHRSVLLNESIEALAIRKDGTYVDGTAGGGGHSFEIASRLENVTFRDKLFSQLHEVVNFAVIHDNHRTVFVVHGL